MVQPTAGPSKLTTTSSHFHTLEREYAFAHPSSVGPQYPAMQALVAPHIASFDALFEGAPMGDSEDPDAVSSSQGLLDLALRDLTSKVVFDGKGKDGEKGNRLESQ